MYSQTLLCEAKSQCIDSGLRFGISYTSEGVGVYFNVKNVLFTHS